MATKVYLSPSNQSNNPYSYGGTNEMVQCNNIAIAAEKYLKQLGFEVKRAPQGQDMYVSIDESNDWGADVHICIHTNAGGGRGCEVYTLNGSAAQLKYARPVYEQIAEITPYGDRGLKTANFAELRLTNAIAVYCECEFHDNAELAKWIVESVDNIGYAIAKGVAMVEGIETKPEAPTEGETTATPVEKPQFSIKAGQKLDLKNEPLFASAYDTVPKSTVYNTYYIWSDEIINGKIKITNTPERVGMKGQVTGWINAPKGAEVKKIGKGDTVRLKAGAKTYTGGSLASFVYNRNHIVKELSGDRAVITYGGVVVAAVNVKDLTLVK